nr:YaaC family protein [uncultured Neokomagataea sp.]
MNAEIWQRLLMLESRDVVDRSYFKIHGRQLSARRSKEISAAARQAREFFRNAVGADFSVKPLLTFYGVASLSRSLTLIFRIENGEEGLSRGHGLETVQWSETLSKSVSNGLLSLGSLRVRTCKGLFADLIRETQNLLCVHANSAAVQGRLCYNIPPFGFEVSLLELLERLPDLSADAAALENSTRYAIVHNITFSKENGFCADVNAAGFERFRQSYEDAGFLITSNGTTATLTGSAELFSREQPQLIHTYIQKNFGLIPQIFIADYFKNRACLSQLSIVYLLSFFLGMLCRYFPTHWISLIQGEKGDAYWPILNRAQHCVEKAFPELVVEMLQYVLESELKKK